jgi:hypothetical protein
LILEIVLILTWRDVLKWRPRPMCNLVQPAAD